jgi:enoyl-CoA hydratase/carnithine racemase
MVQRDTAPEGAIRVETRGRVVVLTIDRPAVRNTLDDAGWLELRDRLRAASDAPDIRVVVITGSGDRAFCAGMDLRQIREGSGHGTAEVVPTPLQAIREVERATKPVLAAVNGDAVGAGGQLALACHLQVAARPARLGFPELRYGLVPAAAGLLPPLIGRSRALGLVLLGELFSATEAHSWGLLTYLADSADQALSETLRIADNLVERDPAAVAGVLQLATSSRGLSPDQVLVATAAYHGARPAPAAPPAVVRKEGAP